VIGHLYFAGPKFTLPNWGVHVVRTNWLLSLAENMSVKGNGSQVSSNEWALCRIHISVFVVDITLGSLLAGPAVPKDYSYVNDTSLVYTNGSSRLNQDLRFPISIPLVVPLTNGNQYQVSMLVQFEIAAATNL